MTIKDVSGQSVRTSFSNDSISTVDARNRVLSVLFSIFLLLVLKPFPAMALGNAPGDVAANLMDVSGNVEVNVLGRSASGRSLIRQWIPAVEGVALHIEDRVRTANGRARLIFTDGREDLDLASTEFLVKADTEIAVADFNVNYENPQESGGLLELIRGAIRNFIKGWGDSGGFSVHAGVALCNLRDGEAEIQYDPAKDVIKVKAVTGKIVLTGAGGSKIMNAGEQAAMVNGFFPGKGPS